MSELNVKPILRQFLLSITGNDIMQTNNNNYGCIDRFIESERFKVALKQANIVATGGGQLTIPDVSQLLLNAYKDGFKAAVDSLQGAYESVEKKTFNNCG